MAVMTEVLMQPDAPLVRSRVVRGVAMLALNGPPANALSADLRRDLWDKIAGFEANPAVKAIVLMSEGRFFSAGVDHAEYDVPASEPTLAELCLRIETCAKPVIAVLQGPALGGGAELAMAAHYRLATAAATIGLPDIAVGLISGAGGTQRLPRLIGADPALRMMLSGKSITADTARTLGLVDGIISGDAGSAGHTFARSLIEAGKPARPTSARRDKIADGAAIMQAVAATRAALPPQGLASSGRIVDCVEAALLLPFAAALDFEAATFEDSLADADSLCLRHIARAERRVSAGVLAPNGKGGWTPTRAGRAVVDALLAAQDRALTWLVMQGVSEQAVDAAYVQWGFATGPFGTSPGAGADPDVRPRVVAALAAEGARQLEAGAVPRASDIDALAVHGLGYPRRAGGPMKAVEIAGLPSVLREMRDWAQQDPVWLAPLRMVQAGRVAGGFAALEAVPLRLE